MKHDTQHLEFLISQYVDGTLDTGSRKTIEQKLLTDPVARDIYKDQRETQDLLDDWGNRLPLINWNDFDAKLADRLEKECPTAPATVSPFRRWIKPAAIAASLLIAVGTGYIFRGMQGGTSLTNSNTPGSPLVVGSSSVNFELPASSRPAMRSVDFSANLPAKAEALGRGAVEVHADPFLAIDDARRLGSGWDRRFGDSRREPTAFGSSLPQTQPGAVRADSAPAPRAADDGFLQ